MEQSIPLTPAVVKYLLAEVVYLSLRGALATKQSPKDYKGLLHQATIYDTQSRHLLRLVNGYPQLQTKRLEEDREE